jgi:hypothetical protein
MKFEIEIDTKHYLTSVAKMFIPVVMSGMSNVHEICT